MNVTATLIKLKEGSQENVDKWATELNSRMDEVLATLEGEGVHEETWFQVSLVDGDYLLVFMREEQADRSRDAAKQSKHRIDAYHYSFKREAWVRGGQIKGKLLVHAIR